MIQKSDGEADSRAEPPATRAGRTAGQARRLAVWSRATIKKQPTLETRFKRGTIDLGVMVRHSSLKLRHSRCRRDLAYSPSRQSCAQWVAGPAPTDRRCNPGLHHR